MSKPRKRVERIDAPLSTAAIKALLDETNRLLKEVPNRIDDIRRSEAIWESEQRFDCLEEQREILKRIERDWKAVAEVMADALPVSFQAAVERRDIRDKISAFYNVAHGLELMDIRHPDTALLPLMHLQELLEAILGK
jgi:hypothetical protein